MTGRDRKERTFSLPTSSRNPLLVLDCTPSMMSMPVILRTTGRLSCMVLEEQVGQYFPIERELPLDGGKWFGNGKN